MGDKKQVASNKMSVTDINDPLFAGRSAKKMASDLLAKYHRGPGDNIETAAYRVQAELGVVDLARRYGVSKSMIWKIRTGKKWASLRPA